LRLYIKPLENLNYSYNARLNFNTDSGVDLFIQSTITCPPKTVTFIGHKIACEMMDDSHLSVPFFLVPRSSISKTPLILANSIGIIDREYRGELIAAVYNTSEFDYIVNRGTRLFQVVLPMLSPFGIQTVSALSDTERGSGGFGSTGA